MKWSYKKFSCINICRFRHYLARKHCVTSEVFCGNTRENVNRAGDYNLVRDVKMNIVNTVVYWFGILKVCRELTSDRNYICLPCWGKYRARRNDREAILSAAEFIEYWNSKNSADHIIICFRHQKTSSYFSFETRLVLRILVCLFLPGSQTCSWDV